MVIKLSEQEQQVVKKATINVPGVLPSTEIKAKTTVKDTTVYSEFSAPVIPTPERDTQPPTVKMTTNK